MKIYFAGLDNKYDKVKELNPGVLLSFAEPKRIIRFLQSNNKKIFLDSGAFSAHSKGKLISLDDYIQFIKHYQPQLEVYATLDVIGDYKKTRENTLLMEKSGLKPLPTFHYGSPITELDEMVSKYDYIALGGLVPLALYRNKMQSWLDYCFSHIKSSTKIHGFGVNAMWAWERYPFYSVDATSFVKWSSYRRFVRFDARNHRFVIITKRDKKLDMIRCHEHNKDLDLDNLKQYLSAVDYITQLWKSRGIVWD